ncbi:MAG: NAD(P)/FAD-dependent oxidoreductase, partial [Ferruginibacter sp.]
MQKDVILKLLPAEAANDETIRKYIASTAATKQSGITGYRINKKSIDARGKQVFIKLQLTAFINEPFIERPVTLFSFKDVGNAEHKVLIIGAGPAGLFAALQLIEVGIQPIIIERGKNVQSRRRHLAVLNKEGIINPESNYCFGEGGAGTYSDGKLYTRSNKRGNIHRILQLFVHFGAPENILYDAHPHIGTNKLPQIITAMREQIIACGGKVLFDKKLIGINRTGDHITSILTADGEQMTADAYILATGHSARDIFEMLKHQNIAIESKPFA